MTPHNDNNCELLGPERDRFPFDGTWLLNSWGYLGEGEHIRANTGLRVSVIDWV
ncbi:hypothetical protein [Arthrobacter methylotrophus]|uniref:hypothetical protein n=1 Tax=Arthrobacter methylotrophus TaxID=121291 RepID=UPI0031F0D14E